MATYPIKVLKDETGVPFVPLVSSTGITSPDGTTLEDSLTAKLEVDNIIAGDNIILEKDGNNITITGTASGAANVVINNLETTEAKQGVLDAYQGYVLNNKIIEMAETLEGGIPKVINNLTTVDSINALSAYQGYLLNSRLGVVEYTKQDKINLIGGYNYFLDPTNMNHSMSAANGITTSYTDGVWKVVSSSGNSNWLSWAHGNDIESNFVEGDQFVFSIEIRADEGFSGKPTIYFKDGMGYFDMQGTVSTNWSVLYYTGTWKDANNVNLHLGWGGAVGTYYIRKISFERGVIPTNAMKYDIKSASQRTHTNWPVNQNFIPDLTFISNWDGAYDANGGSNLCYCDMGRFGSMAANKGGVVSGWVSINYDTTADPTWDYGKSTLEVRTNNGADPSICLHKSGHTHSVIVCNTLGEIKVGQTGSTASTVLTAANQYYYTTNAFVQSSQPTAYRTGDIWFVT